jgi:hypothetical protein
MLPRAREKKLTICRLPDETLVYDELNHKAHCLNPMAALLWDLCDGTRTPSELAAGVGGQLGIPMDEEMALLALSHLEAAGLLKPVPAAAPVQPSTARARLTRREATRRLALSGAMAALVTSIVAPEAQAAASGFPCTESSQCPAGCCCNDAGVRVCRTVEQCGAVPGAFCEA